MRISVMHRTATAQADPDSPAVDITGQGWVLLRALVFQRAGVPTRLLADELRSGTKGYKPSSIPSEIKRLRAKLGSELIQSIKLHSDGGDEENGYALSLGPGDEVDLDEFERLAQALGTEHLVFDDVPPGAGDDVEEKRDAYGLMTVNPGLQDSCITAVSSGYWRLQDYKNRLALATGFGYVRRWLDGGRIVDATNGLSFLRNFASSGTADDEVWKLLFRVAGSLPNRDSLLPDLHALFDKHEQADASADLLDLIQRVEAQDSAVLLGPVETSGVGVEPVEALQRKAFHEAEGNLADVAVLLGISANASLRLRDSRMDPGETIDATISKLWFAGVLGGKYVLDDKVLAKLEKLLDRLDEGEDAQDTVGTPVRLLICDPESREYDALKRLGLIKKRDAESVPILRDLVTRHPSFAVHMYQSRPMFRIIIIDDSLVTVGPYMNIPVDFLPHSGWDVPQLVMTPAAQYPLARGFITLFQDLWNRSRSIEKLAKDWKPE